MMNLIKPHISKIQSCDRGQLLLTAIFEEKLKIFKFSNKKMSELLNEPYNSVLSTPDQTTTIKYPKDFFGHPEGNTLSDINITREDIIDAIKSISQNSSGFSDEFPAIILKQCSKSLAHPLQLLYTASLKTGEIPTDVKRAVITPIYKGGYRNLPKNYLPVDLTPHLIKILEKNISKKYPTIPKNASENEPQATRLPLWQILPLPATGASQQDILGIRKVKQC